MDTQPFFPLGLSRRGTSLFRRVPRLLVMDFDGTLAPIAPTPEAADMPGPLRRSLLRLSRLKETRLAILSGRALPDLKRKTGLPGILLVGNHGLTFSRPGYGWPRKSCAAWCRSSSKAFRLLQPLAAIWKGARLEPKGPDLSLHYRLAQPEDTMHLLPQAERLVRGLPLTTRHGKCVLEFRPQGAPGKGEALERLASRLSHGWRQTGLCVYIGDDATDEDAFRFLRRAGGNALALRVGAGPSRAHYHLRDKHEVLRFLGLFQEGR